MERKYGLGCLKDPQDLRDIRMSVVLPPIRIPAEVDHTPRMSPVRDQGDEGTCVAFAAVVGVKEYQEKEEHGRLIELSPRHLYFRCKEIDGIPHEEGTYPRVAMKILAEKGVCTEACWPYRPHQADAPCPKAEEEARPYRILTYARLGGIEEMKRSLHVNGPFMAGVMVFPSWFRESAVKTGRIPMPSQEEGPVGGHAVCVTGYSESGGLFKFKNSWGTGWGEGGYGALSFAYMERFCMDAWSATDLIAGAQGLVRSIERVIERAAEEEEGG